jgi:hypothetical protein
MNLSFLIFLFFSITRTLIPQEYRNQIGLTTMFLLWITHILTFFLYGKIMGNWSELLYGVENLPLSLIICITYPVFYFFFLPIAIFRIAIIIGTPHSLWERIFSGTAASITGLQCNDDNLGQIVLRYLYIGIPWFIFAVIYIVLMVLLSPLWLFILSPVGTGMYGICLAVGLSSDDVRATSVTDRVERTYRWGMIVNVFGLCLLGMSVSICYVVLVGGHWWAVLLLVVCVLYFGCAIYPTVNDVFCGAFAVVEDLKP